MIEVDETYIGGIEEGLRGRQTESKALVVIAAQQDGKKIGRVRMKQIPDASSASLQAFIIASIEPGSTVVTDGWLGYLGLETLGYTHQNDRIRDDHRCKISLDKQKQPPYTLIRQKQCLIQDNEHAELIALSSIRSGIRMIAFKG
jgi:transposase-like protein